MGKSRDCVEGESGGREREEGIGTMGEKGREGRKDETNPWQTRRFSLAARTVSLSVR